MALLTGDIAAMVLKGLAPLLTDGVLTRSTATGVDSYGDATGTETTFTFRGFRDTKSAGLKDGVPSHRTFINIAAASISTTPQIGDTLSLGGTEFTAIAVETDPATALWVCEVFA
jgi:hypothetical protein